MRGLLLESSALADTARQRAREAARECTVQSDEPGRLEERQSLDLNTRSAIGFGALALSLIGLLGVDTGLLWLVAGVFTIRSLQGRPVGVAWAVACIGAGIRWGSLGLGDVEAATRLVGPTVLAGGPIVRAGMIVALAAALAGEARIGGLRTGPWPDRAAAVIALITLVAAFAVGGPSAGNTRSSIVLWGASGAVAALVVLYGAPIVRRLPSWSPPAAAIVGVVVAGTLR